MKNSIVLYVSVAIGLILWSCSNKLTTIAMKPGDFPSNQIGEAQYELLLSSIKAYPNNTALSVATIKDGTISFVGVERKNDTIRFVDNHKSAFEIGSLSKVFTATLLSELVTSQELKLDDNIQDYLDLKLNIDQDITFRQLANHTSGLPRLPSNFEVSAANQSNPFKHYDEGKLREYLTSEIKLNQEPGAKYEYSNLGSGTLGFVLGLITNSSYETLLEEQIFDKYKMTNSTSKREKLIVKLVNGLGPDGAMIPNWDFGVLESAGAMLSTVEDLSKFALAQFDAQNPALTLTHKPTFEVNANMSVGLGWHILNEGKANELIWHNGGTGGYSSSMTLDLKNKNGIIILSNVSAFNKKSDQIDQLCFNLIKTMAKE